jgi:hypothetical protein
MLLFLANLMRGNTSEGVNKLAEAEGRQSSAEPDPLLNVIGRVQTEDLHRDFKQASQLKLPQPHFALDPGIRKLRHRPLLPIGLFRLLGFGSCPA